MADAKEREARLRHEMYVGIAECGCRAAGYACAPCDARIDRFAAAFRARVVALVEGMQTFKLFHDSEPLISRADLLAALAKEGGDER